MANRKLMTAQTGFDRLVNSQFTRILVVIFLILLLQIPIALLQGLISDRQSLSQETITEITSKWGQQQTIVGPQLVVPYVKRSGSGKNVRTELKTATFLPDDLQINGNVETEVRYRGLFEVPVYKSKIDLNGQFLRPDFSNWGIQPEDIRWGEAEFSLQIADTRAIQNQGVLTWNQAQLPLAPGAGKFGGDRRGVHVNLRGRMEGNVFKFALPLELNGSEKLAFAPFGKVTKAQLESNWGDPSFQGSWLPVEHTISPESFQATWDIPSLGRGYPQQWTSETPVADHLIQESAFGVDFISPVDNYRMVRRSVKYNILFLLLTFSVFWLFEVTVVQLRVHPLQYLLVGTAMCMFYLLQLALSEHIGFEVAYWLASAAVVALVTFYSIAVLKAKQRGGTIGLTQIFLYGYLYIVLAHQSYALLIGSVGLFAFLAVVMFLTRNIDWFNNNQPANTNVDTN